MGNEHQRKAQRNGRKKDQYLGIVSGGIMEYRWTADRTVEYEQDISTW